MEKEEQKWEQADVEEQEEEETTLLVRKSRNGNESQKTEITLSNGVSESNGHKTEAEMAENGDPILGEEQKIGVLGNESEAINGEQNLVFYDKDEGIESAYSTYFGEKQIVKDSFSSSTLQPSQILFQEHSTSFKSSSKEIESAEIDVINTDELGVTESEVERVLKKQTTHDLYCPNCNSCITKRIILRKRKRRVRVSDEEVKRNKIESSDQIHHTDKEGDGDNDTQLPRADEDERDRGPAIFRCLSCLSFFIPTRNGFKLFSISGEKSGRGNVRDEQAPNVKTNWFTSLFGSNKQETTVEQGSSSQTNVRPSSNLRDQSGQPSFSPKPGLSAQASEGLVETAGKNDTREGADTTLPIPRQKPSLNGKVINGDEDKLDMKATETVDAKTEFNSYTSDQLKESKSSKEGHIGCESDLSITTLPKRTQVTNGEEAKEDDPISFPQEDGLKLLISPNKGSHILENSEEGRMLNQIIHSGAADYKEIIQLSPPPVSVLKASDVDGKLNISVSIPHEEQDIRATIVTESILENKHANFRSNESGQVEVSQHIITETKFEVHSGDNISVLKGAPTPAKGDSVITIDTQPTGSSQTVQGEIIPTETASAIQWETQVSNSIGSMESIERRKEFEIEMIKSIVYGGLSELITSLSVVSSAAGGGASTLNILALGMANLIGGLFIICHNLWELRIEQRDDRYRQVLGRRENFIIHTIVVITSYIIFGLVPPVMYGFSHRKSDDRQLKLVVVAAVSILCIGVLAIGRAYVRRHPKLYLKSITTFVILGLMVSGVSYGAGELIQRLLEKLGLFQSSGLFLLEMNPPAGRVAFY